ncbi:10 kDa heat shock protein, mitochondrial-like [Bolinopsis microptera]|uniref:10 kDa heat shock protein, mitochondrial-like n=1 Tax=Bolinopsis microptera TaxID=2820187 RepID=UPI003079AF9E
MSAVARFIPLFDRILVTRAVAASKSKGGIMLPESSQKKLNEGTVVSCGSGALDADGDVIPVSVAVGDKVLLPEYGGTKLNLDDEEYLLIRDSEILGKFVKVTSE